MPRTGNYNNGKIYSIRSYESDDVYIGSTTQPLSLRLAGHRTDYKRYLDGKCGYTTSFKILELGNAYIELVENYSCQCRDELHKREGEIIRATENCVNKFIAGRTGKEWYQDNKDKCKQYYQDNKEHYKQYREANKDKNKQYREDNKEHIKKQKKEYFKKNKDKLKQHYQKNKEYYKQYREQYYKENKDKIKAYRSKKISCDCGGKYISSHKARHEKTKKHMKYIASLSSTEITPQPC